MTRIKDVPDNIKDLPPSTNEELLEIQKQLEQLHYGRQEPWLYTGHERIRADDGRGIVSDDGKRLTYIKTGEDGVARIITEDIPSPEHHTPAISDDGEIIGWGSSYVEPTTITRDFG